MTLSCCRLVRKARVGGGDDLADDVGSGIVDRLVSICARGSMTSRTEVSDNGRARPR